MKDRTRTQHGKSTKIGCFILNIELFILVAELLLDDNAQKFNQLKTPVHGSWYSTHVAHTAQDNPVKNGTSKASADKNKLGCRL